MTLTNRRHSRGALSPLNNNTQSDKAPFIHTALKRIKGATVATPPRPSTTATQNYALNSTKENQVDDINPVDITTTPERQNLKIELDTIMKRRIAHLRRVGAGIEVSDETLLLSKHQQPSCYTNTPVASYQPSKNGMASTIKKYSKSMDKSLLEKPEALGNDTMVIPVCKDSARSARIHANKVKTNGKNNIGSPGTPTMIDNQILTEIATHMNEERERVTRSSMALVRDAALTLHDLPPPTSTNTSNGGTMTEHDIWSTFMRGGENAPDIASKSRIKLVTQILEKHQRKSTMPRRKSFVDQAVDAMPSVIPASPLDMDALRRRKAVLDQNLRSSVLTPEPTKDPTGVTKDVGGVTKFQETVSFQLTPIQLCSNDREEVIFDNNYYNTSKQTNNNENTKVVDSGSLLCHALEDTIQSHLSLKQYDTVIRLIGHFLSRNYYNWAKQADEYLAIYISNENHPSSIPIQAWRDMGSRMATFLVYLGSSYHSLHQYLDAIAAYNMSVLITNQIQVTMNHPITVTVKIPVTTATIPLENPREHRRSSLRRATLPAFDIDDIIAKAIETVTPHPTSGPAASEDTTMSSVKVDMPLLVAPLKGLSDSLLAAGHSQQSSFIRSKYESLKQDITQVTTANIMEVCCQNDANVPIQSVKSLLDSRSVGGVSVASFHQLCEHSPHKRLRIISSTPFSQTPVKSLKQTLVSTANSITNVCATPDEIKTFITRIGGNTSRQSIKHKSNFNVKSNSNNLTMDMIDTIMGSISQRPLYLSPSPDKPTLSHSLNECYSSAEDYLREGVFNVADLPKYNTRQSRTHTIDSPTTKKQRRDSAFSPPKSIHEDTLLQNNKTSTPSTKVILTSFQSPLVTDKLSYTPQLPSHSPWIEKFEDVDLLSVIAINGNSEHSPLISPSPSQSKHRRHKRSRSINLDDTNTNLDKFIPSSVMDDEVHSKKIIHRSSSNHSSSTKSIKHSKIKTPKNNHKGSGSDLTGYLNTIYKGGITPLIYKIDAKLGQSIQDGMALVDDVKQTARQIYKTGASPMILRSSAKLDRLLHSPSQKMVDASEKFVNKFINDSEKNRNGYSPQIIKVGKRLESFFNSPLNKLDALTTSATKALQRRDKGSFSPSILKMASRVDKMMERPGQLLTSAITSFTASITPSKMKHRAAHLSRKHSTRDSISPICYSSPAKGKATRRFSLGSI